MTILIQTPFTYPKKPLPKKTAKGAGDGDGYFSCADGHAMFAPMEQCTLVDAEGNPVKVGFCVIGKFTILYI